LARELSSKEIALRIVKIGCTKKAEEPAILDMRKAANFCDYFVIFSASSNRQAVSVAEAIEEDLRKEKVRLLSAEPAKQKESGWILLDFGFIIVHIFYKPVREFYALEHLWQDAPRIKITRQAK